MTECNPRDLKAIADRLAFQAHEERIRVTTHAHQEMVGTLTP